MIKESDFINELNRYIRAVFDNEYDFVAHFFQHQIGAETIYFYMADNECLIAIGEFWEKYFDRTLKTESVIN